ncbi:hypothetical protein MKK75_01990 [Methylobacterium sp. J-030]|uniref:hypothetical protein n=1 Tax=Methylobacterium sp. J-030 TaxID=2836627 RepID=UPI001FB8748C|nr:hypothetical protein [Methylobacterium sp. J-030]MCJ2067583.1 hypothetical protein [Methylobacterium sp. J-030]
MGLTAFIIFVVPWVLLVTFLTRAPTVLRLGAAVAPWRAIPTRREEAREQRHQSDVRTAERVGSASGGNLTATMLVADH